MIIFFDIMLLNDIPILNMKQHQRRKVLESLVHCSPGSAQLAKYQIVCFSNSTAAQDLRGLVAKCITRHDEGLVMKPADEPYFSFRWSGYYSSCCIKIKKEYFGNFGDIGDFAAIGASYDAQKAMAIGLPNLPWTDFYIGCLENKQDVIQWNHSPRFVVITAITPNKFILKTLMRSIDTSSKPYRNDDQSLRIERGIANGKKPSVIFNNPPIFDLYCFSFDKEGNTGFWTPRFPQISKLHSDRTFLDTITFTELQDLALKAMTAPKYPESTEDRAWVRRLMAADRRGRAVDASSTQDSSIHSARKLSPDPLHRGGSHSKIFFDRHNTVKDYEYGPQASQTTIQPTTSQDVCINPQNPMIIIKSPSLASIAQLENDCMKETSRYRRVTSPVRLSATYEANIKRQKVSTDSNYSGTLGGKARHSLAAFPSPLKQRRPFSEITNYPTTVQTDKVSSKPPTKLHRGKDIKSNMTSSEAEIRGFEESPCLKPPDRFILDNDVSILASPDILLEAACSNAEYVSNEPLKLKSEPQCNVTNIAGNILVSRPPRLLSNCVFALSPCLASIKISTECTITLLGGTVVSCPQEWIVNSRFPSHCAINGYKIRKILLVDIRRLSQTRDFLSSICGLDLKGQNGQREWIEVYDCLVLRAIDGLDIVETIPRWVWRQYWVGAV
jgi:DNA ligase-4